MNLSKYMNKLEEFLGLSEKKKKKKKDHLQKIIGKLEGKKSNLKKKLKDEARKSPSSSKVNKLCQEFKVVTKLLKKANKHYNNI